jgi:phosphoglycolate phosphatase-like HAD superfamily hydrolase
MALHLGELTSKHKLWVFDCDGVVLDSNKLKTEAFYEVALQFGIDAANAMVEYHVSNGGVSRFKKFEWFLRRQQGVDFSPRDHKKLCDQYGQLVKRKLIDCSYTDGFIDILSKLNSSGIKPYIVSGGFEDELRDVFLERKIAKCFSAIYGSPRDKATILGEILSSGISVSEGIFFGDARADYDAARQFQMSFVFVRRYSEAGTWFKALDDESVLTINSFLDIEN